MSPSKTVTVAITGAAGRIAYSLIPLVLGGKIFGPDCGIHLRLLDIPESREKLHGVELEINDSYFPLLSSLVATHNQDEAFSGVEVAILLGGFPRLPGMERKDLLKKNAESIRSQAVALNTFANSNVKVIVVANPANTNCLVAIKSAPRIPPQNFTCLTRLDQERLRNFCAKKVNAPPSGIQNVFILGNHSTTQVAYIQQGVAKLESGETINIRDYFNEEEYKQVLSKVQNRGAEIIKALQLSSAMSAAEAIVQHLKDWLGPEDSGHPFSMGVLSDGNSYGVANDVVFSFPCVRADNEHGYKVVPGYQFDSTTQSLVDATTNELLDEKSQIEEYLS
jgi:malate dehydrogenase